MAATRSKARSKARSKRKPPARARRSLLADVGRIRLHGLPVLEPHHVDVLALALVAVGIFLGGVTYLHWAGGTLGHGTVTALRFLVGELAYAIPVALIAAGVLVLARDLRPPDRPLRAGTICTTLALALALGGGTLGLGSGRPPVAGYWAAKALESRGGALGGAEFWMAKHLLSTAGADILAVFMLLAGGILLSGATLASAVLWARRQTAEARQRSEL